MWPWKRKLPEGDFPPDFVVQKIRHKSVSSVSRLTGPEIAAFFRQNPSTAKELLVESYDKRFSPSTFLSEEADEYSVEWFSRRAGYQCQIRFDNLADAATDYVLFSLGRGRWTPPEI